MADQHKVGGWERGTLDPTYGSSWNYTQPLLVPS